MAVEIRKKLDEIFPNGVIQQPKLKDLATIVVDEKENAFLTELCENIASDEDVVFVAIAEELNGDFLEYVGGKAFAKELLGPLENLARAGSEMPKLNAVRSVRAKAVQSLRSIADKFSTDGDFFKKHFVPLVVNLALDQALPSAFQLLSVCYKHMNKDKKETVLNEFKSPRNMEMQAFLEIVGKETVKTTIHTLYQNFADDQEVCALALVVSLWVAPGLTEVEIDNLIYQHMNTSTLSSTVRLSIADKFFQMQAVVGAERLFSFYKPLLEETDVNLGKEAALKLKDFCKKLNVNMKQAFIDKLFAWIQSYDGSEDVEAAVVEVMMEPNFFKGRSTQLIEVLQKEFEKGEPIRRTIISKLHLIIKDIKSNQLTENFQEKICNGFVSMAKDEKEKSCIDPFAKNVLPFLAKHMTVGQFESTLKPVYTFLLTASSPDVRESAICSLEKLVKKREQDLGERVVAFLRNLNEKNENRITVLACFGRLAKVFSEELKKELVSNVIEMKSDDSEEVRVQVCETLCDACCKKESWSSDCAGLDDKVREALCTLKNDQNEEVQEAAEEAICEVFGTSGPFKAMRFDFFNDKPNTELWIRLCYLFLSIMPLLHSLAEKVIGKLVAELKKETSKKREFLRDHHKSRKDLEKQFDKRIECMALYLDAGTDTKTWIEKIAGVPFCFFTCTLKTFPKKMMWLLR